MPTNRQRLAWAITGSGHYLRECLDLLAGCRHLDLFLSDAAREVLQLYQYDIKNLCPNAKLYHDRTASSVLIGRFYQGYYRAAVIAPATSNTLAKCVLGISDTIVTNIYAHAGKCRVPVVVFACDAVPELTSEAPDGIVKVYPRKIDLENTEKLMAHEGTSVVLSLAELRARFEEINA